MNLTIRRFCNDCCVSYRRNCYRFDWRYCYAVVWSLGAMNSVIPAVGGVTRPSVASPAVFEPETAWFHDEFVSWQKVFLFMSHSLTARIACRSYRDWLLHRTWHRSFVRDFRCRNSYLMLNNSVLKCTERLMHTNWMSHGWRNCWNVTCWPTSIYPRRDVISIWYLLFSGSVHCSIRLTTRSCTCFCIEFLLKQFGRGCFPR